MGEDDITEEQQHFLKIAEKRGLTANELERVLKTLDHPGASKGNQYEDYLKGRRFKIGLISDTHIGHKEFKPELFAHMGKVMKKERVKRLYHAGDILEGMSGRDGHVYELDQIGFSNQINYAAELWNKHLSGIPSFGINGNHDLWYAKRNNGGMDVAEELELRVPDFNSLGSSEADVMLRKNLKLRLFHPGDGTAYATSYKLQKLIESFEGGKKPDIVAEGHYHKALYMFLRNIHGLECGTLCGQTDWMRGKKIQAHTGFWVLDVQPNGRRGGVGALTPTFFPSYD